MISITGAAIIVAAIAPFAFVLVTERRARAHANRVRDLRI
jgi:hypothetical protein